MDLLKIDRTKLITQTEYAKLINRDKSTVNYMIKNKKVKTVKIKGATLIYLD